MRTQVSAAKCTQIWPRESVGELRLREESPRNGGSGQIYDAMLRHRMSEQRHDSSLCRRSERLRALGLPDRGCWHKHTQGGTHNNLIPLSEAGTRAADGVERDGMNALARKRSLGVGPTSSASNTERSSTPEPVSAGRIMATPSTRGYGHPDATRASPPRAPASRAASRRA